MAGITIRLAGIVIGDRSILLPSALLLALIHLKACRQREIPVRRPTGPTSCLRLFTQSTMQRQVLLQLGPGSLAQATGLRLKTVGLTTFPTGGSLPEQASRLLHLRRLRLRILLHLLFRPA